MQETLTFPTLGSPPRFTFPELHTNEHTMNACYSELSSSTSTPYVSAPSSPSRMKGFYFSAPTSPTWAQRTLLLQQEEEDHRSSSWAEQSLQTDPHRSSNWAQQSLHTELYSSPDLSQRSLRTTELERSWNWAQQPQKSLHTELDRSSNCGAQQPLQAEHHSNLRGHQKVLQQAEDTGPAEEHHTWHQKALHTEHERSPRSAENHSRFSSYQKTTHTHHERKGSPSSTECHGSSHMKDSHSSSSTCTQKLYPIITNPPKHTALKRIQVEDLDAPYSRKSFYASAIPFSWEEKPGTPKARSVASETSNGDEDDSPSVLLSGSSEFEFSARFAEPEDVPMSPTPISSTFNSFKHQSAGSLSPTYADSNEADQIWPLRLPPCLDNPVLPMKQLIKDEANEHQRSYGSLSSLSAPQSPRSPRIFHIRGVFCGISNPAPDAVFDPFLAAMEKSMGDNEAMKKSVRKDNSRSSHGHHRRAQSLSPLRVFHWDDHSAKSNLSSNGSSCMDEVKNKHPIQREINARHSAGTPKVSKRWSFKGLLHRKSASGSSGESASRHSNTTSSSLRSSGHESCGSPAARMGREVAMDVSDVDENAKARGASMGVYSPTTNNSSLLSSIPSSPSSILSSSSSGNSTSRGKLNAHRTNKPPLALHYSMQRAQTEELRKKTFLPYKQGLLGCLGLSSKSYRALAAISKPLQSVS